MITPCGATDAANGAGAPGVQHSGGCAVDWHVVVTEHQAERLAAQSVADLGFATCLPLIRRRTSATAARAARTIVFPAFAGYLFVAWAARAEWQRVRRSRGVSGVLTSIGADVPAVVPVAFMAALHSRMGADGVLEDLSVPDLLPALPAMTWARITKGPLSGSIAFVEWSTEERVGVLLEMMGGERRAKLRRDQVEPTDPL